MTTEKNDTSAPTHHGFPFQDTVSAAIHNTTHAVHNLAHKVLHGSAKKEQPHQTVGHSTAEKPPIEHAPINQSGAQSQAPSHGPIVGPSTNLGHLVPTAPHSSAPVGSNPHPVMPLELGDIRGVTEEAEIMGSRYDQGYSSVVSEAIHQVSVANAYTNFNQPSHSLGYPTPGITSDSPSGDVLSGSTTPEQEGSEVAGTATLLVDASPAKTESSTTTLNQPESDYGETPGSQTNQPESTQGVRADKPQTGASLPRTKPDYAKTDAGDNTRMQTKATRAIDDPNPNEALVPSRTDESPQGDGVRVEDRDSSRTHTNRNQGSRGRTEESD